jgi:hypothetical protein
MQLNRTAVVHTAAARRVRVLAAGLAIAMIAMAPATGTAASGDGRTHLENGLTVEADRTVRIPVTLDEDVVLDVRPEGDNVQALPPAGAGMAGFALIGSDETVAAVVAAAPYPSLPGAQPIAIGLTEEAGDAVQVAESELGGSCDLCAIEAGQYDLIIIAEDGPTTVTVVLGDAARRLHLDAEAVEALEFEPWPVYHITGDTADRPGPNPGDGPSVAGSWMQSTLRCWGCTLPRMFAVHDGLPTIASALPAAGAGRYCTGTSPLQPTDCSYAAVTTPSGPATTPYREWRTLQPAPAITASQAVDTVGIGQTPRLRLGLLLIPVPTGSSSAAQEAHAGTTATDWPVTWTVDFG